KQLAPVGKNGEPILKFSLYDAIEAGFKKVVFIIKEEISADFKALIGDLLRNKMEVKYVYQELDKLPQGYVIPEGRVKPWGTGHAILCAKDALNGPFAVINADDYYGRDAFQIIYNCLIKQRDDDKYRFSMVGYLIENTLTDSGHVTRGVCKSQNGFLTKINERHRIEKHGNIIEYTEDEGSTWNEIKAGTLVSMNLWGFTQGIFNELENGFPIFLDSALKHNPITSEYLLPLIVDDLLKENKATVKVLRSADAWYGITYNKDLPKVQSSIRAMQNRGIYPDVLF
ncbi:MAG TPA: sugar phosphate nucleotidyltransferase, partial [Anaerovoracaceae bacterium]|nr:sugar phosphate nucleotidyltransferase [Anaerovoracaceae bacterium]